MKTIITLVVFIIASTSIYAEEYNPGKSWNRTNQDFHVAWVWGAAKGQELIFEELQIKNTNTIVNFISMDDADSISQIMTTFYVDPSNTYIPWKYMMVVASKKLKGASTTTINQELEMLRAYATYERSKK